VPILGSLEQKLERGICWEAEEERWRLSRN